MRPLADALAAVPGEVRRAGGSLPLRLAVLALALAANLGFYLPSIPAQAPGAGIPGADKLVHVGVFALTVWAAGRLLAPRRRFPMGWVVLAALAHAVLVELVQALLPARSPGADDVLADALGIGLGVLAWMLERRLRPEPGGDGARGGGAADRDQPSSVISSA